MNEQAITRAVEPVLTSHGLELDRLEIVPAGRRSVVRITVDGDGPHGRGPLLDDIAEAARDLSAALDAANIGNQPYTLEVSSRGTSRPLTEPKHFRRNLTRLVRIVLADGEVVEGRILAADDTVVQLDPERRIAFTDITRATIQVELNRPEGLGPDDDDSDDDDFDDDGADEQDEED
ncbi:MAG: ribosome maturation factor RimP [Propionibacterium sp.]|nr:ribosome maturation factor RimP [Propionibacterium sp.]